MVKLASASALDPSNRAGRARSTPALNESRPSFVDKVWGGFMKEKEVLDKASSDLPLAPSALGAGDDFFVDDSDDEEEDGSTTSSPSPPVPSPTHPSPPPAPRAEVVKPARPGFFACCTGPTATSTIPHGSTDSATPQDEAVETEPQNEAEAAPQAPPETPAHRRSSRFIAEVGGSAVALGGVAVQVVPATSARRLTQRLSLLSRRGSFFGGPAEGDDETEGEIIAKMRIAFPNHGDDELAR
jgi:hypothetical protein